MQLAHENFFQSRLPGLWQVPRVHRTTFWIKWPCHLNSSGNYLTSSWKFSKTEGQLYYLGHLMCPLFPGVWASHGPQLYSLTSSLLGKNCSWSSFCQICNSLGSEKHNYSPGCRSSEVTKIGGGKNEIAVLFKSGQKMPWILEEILFTSVFINQGGGHPWKGFSGQPLEIWPICLACALSVFSLFEQVFTSQQLELFRVTGSSMWSCNFTESFLLTGLGFDKHKKYAIL